MTAKEIFQFICLELQNAVKEKSKERILDLGTTSEILYEAAKKQNNKKALDLLLRINYVVFHYDEEFSFTDQYLQEIEKQISQM